MFEQERVLTRLQLRVNRDGGIVVCLLGGSFGRRAADGYADLNVLLGFDGPAGRQQAWEARTAFAASVLPYVACTARDEQEGLRALYGNGALVTYAYHLASDLRDLGGVRVLKAPAGWPEPDPTPAPAAALPPPTSQTLADLDAAFWPTFWNILRRTLRGENERPFPAYVQLLHDALPPLLDWLPAGHPLRTDLIQRRYGTDAAGNAAELQRLLTSYRQARDAVIAVHRLDYRPDPRLENELLRLLARLI